MSSYGTVRESCEAGNGLPPPCQFLGGILATGSKTYRSSSFRLPRGCDSVARALGRGVPSQDTSYRAGPLKGGGNLKRQRLGSAVPFGPVEVNVMPYVLIRHKVADYLKWKRVFDAHGATRKAGGSKGGRLFRSADKPKEILILLRWGNLRRARRFIKSADLRKAMKRAGVKDRPDVYFLQERARPTA